MKSILLLYIIASLTACSGNKGDGTGLSGSDSLVINFNTKGSNTIEKTISTTEKTAIKRLSGFVDGKTVPEYKCGYDGNILFYKKDSLVGDLSFNFSDEGCHHFVQIVEGKLNSTKMSNEAADFLKSLSEGKNWY